MTDNDEYVQYLQDQIISYTKKVTDIRENAEKEAESATDKLIDMVQKKLKQDVDNQKDALNKKLDLLKDFYDKQKELMDDAYDEEKYREEQAEHHKTIAQLEAELASLQYDNSAWAEKRKKELAQELADRRKEYSDFEKDHAKEVAEKDLDRMKDLQVEDIEAEIEALDNKYKDAKTLYEEALKIVQNGSISLYNSLIEYNNKYGDGIAKTVTTAWNDAYKALKDYYDLAGKAYNGIILTNAGGYTNIAESQKISAKGYASGTARATRGLHLFEEEGTESTFESANGSRYKMFTGGEMVLNHDASTFLYNFANKGKDLLKTLFATDGIRGLMAPSSANNVQMGDIIINGDASQATVSEIRRAQRESVNFMLKELNRIHKI